MKLLFEARRVQKSDRARRQSSATTQWLANTRAPGVAADDRRQLDYVIYGAAARGEALCCDAALVSPIRRDGRPQAGAPERDGVAIATAQRRKLVAPKACWGWGALQRRIPALGAEPHCNACAPCPCHARSLGNASVARSRKRRAACRGPPVRS